jgi:hypothetical protein
MELKSLKEIERTVHRSVLYEDGLTDIGWGFIFLAIGIIPTLEGLGYSPYWGFLLFLAPQLLHHFGKKYITAPRLGLIKFNPDWKSKRKKVTIFLAVTATITGILVILTHYRMFPSTGDFFGEHTVMIYIGLGVMSLLFIIAYLIDFNRLYIYAVLIGVGLPLGNYLNSYTGKHWGELLLFGVISLLVFIVGSIIFRRFLIKYQKSNPEITHE